MNFIATTSISQSFYCAEVSSWDVGGSASSRISRTQPNTNFGNILPPGLSDIAAVTCTEWHSFQGNGSTQINPHVATTSVDNSEFFWFSSYVIIFFLVIIIIFNIFNWNNPWRAQ